jgi:hypothetical protein
MLVTEFIFPCYIIISCDVDPFLAYFPFLRSHSGVRVCGMHANMHAHVYPTTSVFEPVDQFL